jgi:hypothetical protein
MAIIHHVRTGGLAKFQLNRVLDYAESSQNEDIRLSSLAQAAGPEQKPFRNCLRTDHRSQPSSICASSPHCTGKGLLHNPVRSVLEACALTGFSTKAISARSADALWALLLASFVHGHRGSGRLSSTTSLNLTSLLVSERPY